MKWEGRLLISNEIVANLQPAKTYNDTGYCDGGWRVPESSGSDAVLSALSWRLVMITSLHRIWDVALKEGSY